LISFDVQEVCVACWQDSIFKTIERIKWWTWCKTL